jgi:hypothetical protein
MASQGVPRVDKPPSISLEGRAGSGGCVAQLVEQLTLNQRVQGSNPCTPTNLLGVHSGRIAWLPYSSRGRQARLTPIGDTACLMVRRLGASAALQ